MTGEDSLTSLVLEQQVAEPVIELHDIRITYPGMKDPVVHAADFHLQRGETVLFLGPSGCGKSTFAMFCARLLPGSVEGHVEGEYHFANALLKPGGIGYVFQDPDAQFCQLTVGDEVAFGLENKAVPPSKMDAQIRRALSRADSKVPFTANHALFSGGMKQKLAIASALALEPELLVLDEPTANLDPAASRLTYELIAQLKAAGQTMIVIEHKFERLLDVADRIVLFRGDGSIYKTGCTLDIVRDEWEWMTQQGIIPPWKTKPKGRVQKDSLSNRRDTKEGRVPRAANSTAAFSLCNAELHYGQSVVWKDVNLDIPAGTITAIVGPNGVGKSSLLQVLAGLTRLTKGNLQVLGVESTAWKTKDWYRRLAYCFQNPELQFIYERVGDELANRVTNGALPEEIRNLLQEFGLDGTEHQSPFALSQGQKRRLSVAVMLRENHDAYLFDEPTFGQDAHTQKAIADKLVQLADAGKTVVMTSHDMELVGDIADFVVVLHESGVLYTGLPGDLAKRPDVLKSAHLRDDLLDTEGDEFSAEAITPSKEQSDLQHSRVPVRKQVWSPLRALNPAFLFLSMMATGIVALWVNTLVSGGLIFAFALVLMLTLGWVRPLQIVKWLSPFVAFYILYIWSFAAYAKVPPGVRTVNFLWVHLSQSGLHEGEVLAVRMLASVGFALLFVFSINITRLTTALIVNLRVPPKFAYGALAGMRVVPLFQEEWQKLRQARKVRGKSGLFFTRPITYALPLLSQAIRMSERVAIAMEARGFTGRALSRKHRTYYTEVRIAWYDYVAVVIIPVIALVLLFL